MTQALDAALEKQDWGALFLRLTDYTRRRLGQRGGLQHAEDIAGEAVRQVLDPKYKGWDPAAGDLLWHLQSVVNGILANLRRTRSRAGEELRDLGQDTPDGRFHSYDRTEQRIEAAETLDAVLNEAIAANDELSQLILMEALEGRVERGEVARKLGVPTSSVYEARRRLGRYLEDVLAQNEDE